MIRAAVATYALSDTTPEGDQGWIAHARDAATNGNQHVAYVLAADTWSVEEALDWLWANRLPHGPILLAERRTDGDASSGTIVQLRSLLDAGHRVVRHMDSDPGVVAAINALGDETMTARLPAAGARSTVPSGGVNA